MIRQMCERDLVAMQPAVCFALSIVLVSVMAGCHATVTVPTLPLMKLAAPPTHDDPVWDTVPAVALTLNQTEVADGQTPHEPGHAKLAYDDHAIYLRIDFVDHDVTTLAGDHDNLYLNGDVAEWFIGTPPRGRAAASLPGRYIELHVAPNGARTAYRIDRPGLIERIDPIPFTAEVTYDGTLNDDRDRDAGWSALFTLPWATLHSLDPGGLGLRSNLTTLISRYNYGHELPYKADGSAGPELIMWPAQPRTSYHLRPFHAPMMFDE